MKSRDTLLRLKRFQVDEKRRRVGQIDAMIAEFTRMASDLDRDIAAEERRTGISDPAHFAYSTYARAARTRSRRRLSRDRNARAGTEPAAHGCPGRPRPRGYGAWSRPWSFVRLIRPRSGRCKALMCHKVCRVSQK